MNRRHDKLDELEQKLRDIEEKNNAFKSQKKLAGGSRGYRMAADFVSGFVVGFLIGWGLDYVFNTKPLMIVIFSLLGFAAGVANIIRAQKIEEARRATDK